MSIESMRIVGCTHEQFWSSWASISVQVLAKLSKAQLMRLRRLAETGGLKWLSEDSLPTAHNTSGCSLLAQQEVKPCFFPPLFVVPASGSHSHSRDTTATAKIKLIFPSFNSSSRRRRRPHITQPRRRRCPISGFIMNHVMMQHMYASTSSIMIASCSAAAPSSSPELVEPSEIRLALAAGRTASHQLFASLLNDREGFWTVVLRSSCHLYRVQVSPFLSWGWKDEFRLVDLGLVGAGCSPVSRAFASFGDAQDARRAGLGCWGYLCLYWSRPGSRWQRIQTPSGSNCSKWTLGLVEYQPGMRLLSLFKIGLHLCLVGYEMFVLFTQRSVKTRLSIVRGVRCVNVREWRACVNMGDRLLSKFVWMCAVSVFEQCEICNKRLLLTQDRF